MTLGRPAWDHIGLVVQDLTQALECFSEAVASEARFVEVDQPLAERMWGVECGPLRVAFVQIGGHMLELIEHADTAIEQIPPLHVAVRVHDLDAVLDSLATEGFTSLSQAPVSTNGRLTAVAVGPSQIPLQVLCDIPS